MKRLITLDSSNIIIVIRTGNFPGVHEIESETGEIGQIMQPDGTFVTPEPEPIEPVPTLEEMQMQTLLNTEYLVVMSELTNM